MPLGQIPPIPRDINWCHKYDEWYDCPGQDHTKYLYNEVFKSEFLLSIMGQTDITDANYSAVRKHIRIETNSLDVREIGGKMRASGLAE